MEVGDELAPSAKKCPESDGYEVSSGTLTERRSGSDASSDGR